MPYLEGAVCCTHLHANPSCQPVSEVGNDTCGEEDGALGDKTGWAEGYCGCSVLEVVVP